jgi:hypothetical protein
VLRFLEWWDKVDAYSDKEVLKSNQDVNKLVVRVCNEAEVDKGLGMGTLTPMGICVLVRIDEVVACAVLVECDVVVYAVFV